MSTGRNTARFRFGAMSRRAALTGAALAAMGALAACGGDSGGQAAQGDMAKGAPEGAEVTVVEYASVTCGHCAQWQETVWPEFKAKYVDTNKVRFVFREFPTPPAEVAAAGFLLARCAGEDRYFQVIEEIMASQREWQQGISPAATLSRVATSVGLSEDEYRACITDADALAALDERIQAGRAEGVTGTPTFFVNGTRVPDSSLQGLSAAVDAELAK
ncbi:DsbA family protein [Brevundimonas poindexterae]|uniref:DsbA family protein n=1 Tax=Brevundimonas poindexterae TaxID=74325 RepID=UPI001CFDC8AA|nr:thioredoxin domain-containing protein [Brevundimonas poindexterae]